MWLSGAWMEGQGRCWKSWVWNVPWQFCFQWCVGDEHYCNEICTWGCKVLLRLCLCGEQCIWSEGLPIGARCCRMKGGMPSSIIVWRHNTKKTRKKGRVVLSVSMCVRMCLSSRSIAGAPSSRALPGFTVTVHHLCAFLLYLKGYLCDNITTTKKGWVLFKRTCVFSGIQFMNLF